MRSDRVTKHAIQEIMAPILNMALRWLYEQITYEEEEQEEAEALENAKEALERVSLELSSKVRNLELENEKLTRMYQEMMVCVTEGNRAKMELTDQNHKQQMELNIITTWWQDAEKENTKLVKNASRLRSQKVETLDLLDKERNQNLILNNHIQQLQEERKKEKKEDEEVIKDLQRQLTTLQRAMTSPQNHTSKQHECTGNEQHHVCIVMEEEEEDHAENLQKEEEHGQEERSSHQKEEKGQNLQKDPSQDLSSQEQEDSEQKNHQVIQEMTSGHSAAAADKLCLKMVEKTKQKMTSEESTIVERTERTGLMTSNDDVSKSRMIAEERTVSECTERTDLMSSKEDVSKSKMIAEERTVSEHTEKTDLMSSKDDVRKSKMEQKEERVMTPMRSWRDDLMAKALNEAKAPWREVSDHAKDQNKAETMAKAQHEAKAPSMIRALKQPEHNRQLCTERMDLKEHKGDMSKNNTIAEEKTLLERLEQKKLMNYWKSRAVVIDMIDET